MNIFVSNISQSKLPLEAKSYFTIASDKHYKNTTDMFQRNTNVSNIYQSGLHILIWYGTTPAFISIIEYHMELMATMHVNKY